MHLCTDFCTNENIALAGRLHSEQQNYIKNGSTEKIYNDKIIQLMITDSHSHKSYISETESESEILLDPAVQHNT